MSLKLPDLRNRSARVDILPDTRQRLTRVYTILNEVTKSPTATATQPGLSGYILPWGTVDSVPASQGTSYAGLRLVKQDFSGQAELNDDEEPTKKLPTLTRVYETLNDPAETEVGNTDITIDQDDLTECDQNFLQLSGRSPTFQTPGTSAITAPNGVTCYLKSEERTDDGTLQRIKRHYISKGQIAQTIDIKFDGALTIETDTYVNMVPPTPGGYTLVDKKIEHPNGNFLATYTFALGTGQISNLTEYRLSPDQGTTGVTVQTIKYISTPSVSSNPISTPAGGYEEISVEMAESDGYRMWTAIYAFGQGTIATEVDIKLDGNLQLTTITAINAAPSAPAPSLGGTVVLIKTDVRNGTRFEDGTKIYTYTWAEAKGGSNGAQVSIDTEYLQSIDTGTNGVTRVRLKYVVAPGSSVQPTSLSGFILVSQGYEDVEGYGTWTTLWAKGQGLVVDEKEIAEFGFLIKYHRTGLGAAPTTPSATIGGTVVTITSGTRNAEGYQIYDYHYAEGKGLVVDESEVAEIGSLVKYHRTALGGAPSTPSATIGGTVTLVESETRNADGYQIFDYHWAEGNGQSKITTRGEPDGALLYEVITYTLAASTPAYPGTGTAYLIDLDQDNKAGYYENRATYKKPPASTTLNVTKKFRLPGELNILSGSNTEIEFVPPVDMDILAQETIDYGTTQVTTAPYTVSAWPFVTWSYTPTNQPTPKQTVSYGKAAAGYLAGSSGTSGTNSNFNGIPCDSWAYTITASTPTAPPSGSKVIEVNNYLYLTDVTGVQVFRRHSVAHTF